MACGRTAPSAGGGLMKKARPAESAKPSAPNSAKFKGTDNPGHLRAINALMRRTMPRESFDIAAGCRNGHESAAELRRRGFFVLCKRIQYVHRDGNTCRPGVYSFTVSDRRKVYRWQAEQQRGEHG